MSSAAVDPCMYLPCIHGQCESHPTVDILNYTCSCDDGYTGPLCDIGKILLIIPRALVDIILNWTSRKILAKYDYGLDWINITNSWP